MQRHRFDPVSFVFGALLTGLALIGLTDLIVLRLVDLRWIGPAVLVLLGLVLVVTAGRGAANGDTDTAPTPEPEPPANHAE